MTGLGAMMAGGNPQSGRQGDDFYPTPPDVTRALFTAWRPQSLTVWEPAAGNGAMAQEIVRAGHLTISTDVAARGPGVIDGVNFLKTPERFADCIITNPPFELASQFIEHAFDLGVSELALVLKSTYWHAAKRQGIWEAHRPAMILPLTWRPDFLNRGGPTMEICWTIWYPRAGADTVYRPLKRPAATVERQRKRGKPDAGSAG